MNYVLKISWAILFLYNISILNGSAPELKYKISDIPAALLVDAKAVVRNSETIIEISDISRIVKRVTNAITILNESGISNSVLTQYYDKFMTVRKIKADLFDRYGVPIKNGANMKVEDYSSNVGYSLYEDNRVKVLDPKYRTLPFTVEFTYEIEYNGLFFYPDWAVYDDYNVSVERSTFTVVTPLDFKFRYLEKNLTSGGTKSRVNEKIRYNWDYSDMQAIKNEPFGKHFMEYTPVVYSAPSDFETGGYPGNLDSWDNFGKWIDKLGRGRGVLGKDTDDKIKKMVDGLSDENEKIKVLYSYLQNKVRYVNVKIGIGGWQTIEAEAVDRLSYGDCKALSNYMKALLDVVGIKSYYTLVRAGEWAPPINADFPSTQFNHVILCIPQNSDTLWLECTSQNIPFGYLGTFTDDRKALLTSNEGGILVSTKKYILDDNRQIRHAFVDLSSDGNATSTVSTDYTGILYDKIYRVLQMDNIDGMKFVQSNISIPSFKLISYSHRETKSTNPVIGEDLKLDLPNYGIKIGDRILFKPNLMTRVGKMPYLTKDRKSGIRIRRPYSEIDTIRFRLPVNYKIDKVPSKISIVEKFGEYTAEIFSDGKSGGYLRTFKLFKNDYPVEDYPAFVDFFEKISACDESKIALIKDL